MQVAKAAPDGYTILQNTNGGAIAPALYSSLPFDPYKDFAPVTQIIGSILVFVTSLKSDITRSATLSRAPGEAGQAQLRLERRRQPAASDHGNAQARDRHRHRLGAVPR